jgi:hypothetical protein
MKTADEYEQLLWLIRTHNGSTREAFIQPFAKTIQLFTARKKNVSARNSAKAAIAGYLRELKSSAEKTNVMDITRKLIAVHMIDAATLAQPTNTAKLHHWLPLCYLRDFTLGIEQPLTRGAFVPTLNYDRGVQLQAVSSDKTFIHPANKNSGFYQDAAESFFGNVESWYSEVMNLLKLGHREPNNYELAMLVCMLVVQTLRSPRPDGSFRLRTLSEFSTAADALMDSIGNGYAYVVPSEKPMPFLSYAPTRRRVLASGAVAWYFPISSNRALVVSQDELTKQQLEVLVEGSRIATVKWAHKNQKPLFGFGKQDFDELKSEVAQVQ